MIPASALLLLCLLAAAGLLHMQRRAAAELAAAGRDIRRVAAALAEGVRAQAQLETLRLVTHGAEQTVQLGAETVRAVHLGIAAIPFGILEAIPVTRPTTRLVRGIHDGISNVVYDTITGANRLLGSTLRQNLAPPAKPPPPEEGADQT